VPSFAGTVRNVAQTSMGRTIRKLDVRHNEKNVANTRWQQTNTFLDPLITATTRPGLNREIHKGPYFQFTKM